jgi:hypothetical protein
MKVSIGERGSGSSHWRPDLRGPVWTVAGSRTPAVSETNVESGAVKYRFLHRGRLKRCTADPLLHTLRLRVSERAGIRTQLANSASIWAAERRCPLAGAH